MDPAVDMENENMKNILIIAPFFAPYSHAAVYRTHRFAKYLPLFGWKVYVLTLDKAFLFFLDNSLLEDLPKDVEIITARYIALTYAGIKSLFKKFNPPTSSDLVARLQQRENKKNIVKNIMYEFRKEVIFFPDRYITWYPFALNKAKDLINAKNISVIYSTASPFTAHLIAMKLKAWSKLPWVADFRDPGVEERRLEFSTKGFNYKLNCIIEKKIMQKADLILTICEGAKDLFLSKYKGIVDNKIACIKTGTDTEILKAAKLSEKSRKFTIIFVGEFLPQYNRKIFEILKVMFERNFFERKKIEVLIIGSLKRNMYLEKEIESFGLRDVVRLIDYVSLRDYFSILLSADATLLPGSFKNAMPIKITDYLFTKKPIIAFDANDEIRSMLEKSGLGIFMPEGIEEGIRVLVSLFTGQYKININEKYINQFTAFNQTRQLTDVLSKL